MITLGAVVVDARLDRTFYGCLKPMTDRWDPSSLAISGFSREETMTFEAPHDVMVRLDAWLAAVNVGDLHFISDNNGFDWQFVNFYFHHFLGRNPFGHASLHLGSLYKGAVHNMVENFKHLRRTAHTHNALDDALGNAEAFLAICRQYGVTVEW